MKISLYLSSTSLSNISLARLLPLLSPFPSLFLSHYLFFHISLSLPPLLLPPLCGFFFPDSFSFSLLHNLSIMRFIPSSPALSPLLLLFFLLLSPSSDCFPSLPRSLSSLSLRIPLVFSPSPFFSRSRA